MASTGEAVDESRVSVRNLKGVFENISTPTTPCDSDPLTSPQLVNSLRRATIASGEEPSSLGYVPKFTSDLNRSTASTGCDNMSPVRSDGKRRAPLSPSSVENNEQINFASPEKNVVQPVIMDRKSCSDDRVNNNNNSHTNQLLSNEKPKLRLRSHLQDPTRRYSQGNLPDLTNDKCDDKSPRLIRLMRVTPDIASKANLIKKTLQIENKVARIPVFKPIDNKTGQERKPCEEEKSKRGRLLTHLRSRSHGGSFTFRSRDSSADKDKQKPERSESLKSKESKRIIDWRKQRPKDNAIMNEILHKSAEMNRKKALTRERDNERQRNEANLAKNETNITSIINKKHEADNKRSSLNDIHVDPEETKSKAETNSRKPQLSDSPPERPPRRRSSALLNHKKKGRAPPPPTFPCGTQCGNLTEVNICNNSAIDHGVKDDEEIKSISQKVDKANDKSDKDSGISLANHATASDKHLKETCHFDADSDQQQNICKEAVERVKEVIPHDIDHTPHSENMMSEPKKITSIANLNLSSHNYVAEESNNHQSPPKRPHPPLAEKPAIVPDRSVLTIERPPPPIVKPLDAQVTPDSKPGLVKLSECFVIVNRKGSKDNTEAENSTLSNSCHANDSSIGRAEPDDCENKYDTKNDNKVLADTSQDVKENKKIANSPTKLHKAIDASKTETNETKSDVECESEDVEKILPVGPPPRKPPRTFAYDIYKTSSDQLNSTSESANAELALSPNEPRTNENKKSFPIYAVPMKQRSAKAPRKPVRSKSDLSKGELKPSIAPKPAHIINQNKHIDTTTSEEVDAQEKDLEFQREADVRFSLRRPKNPPPAPPLSTATQSGSVDNTLHVPDASNDSVSLHGADASILTVESASRGWRSAHNLAPVQNEAPMSLPPPELHSSLMKRSVSDETLYMGYSRLAGDEPVYAVPNSHKRRSSGRPEAGELHYMCSDLFATPRQRGDALQRIRHEDLGNKGKQSLIAHWTREFRQSCRHINKKLLKKPIRQ